MSFMTMTSMSEGPYACDLPSYESFRQLAKFVPELGDYGLDEREYSKLLASQGLESLGALGLGDTQILFATNAVKGFIGYDSVCKICRVLAHRLKALQARTGKDSLQAAVAAAVDKSMRVNTELRTLPAPALPQYMRNAISAGPGGREGSSGGPARRSQELPDKPPADQAPLETTFSRAGRFTRLALRPSSAIVATSANLGPSPPHSPSPSPPKSRLDRTGIINSVGGHSAAFVTSSLAAKAADTGMTEPPAVLREAIPVPTCEFPKVRNMISGVQVMFNNGELRNASSGLKEIREEWVLQLEEKVARSLSKKGAPPSNLTIPLRQEVPSEGLVWLHLMTAALSLSEGHWHLVRDAVAAAEQHYNTKQMGEQHAYKYITALVRGLMYYYQAIYRHALDEFEVAREMAETLCRAQPTDAFNVKNNAAALNNKAVCLLLLGRRMEGVACLRAAAALLKHRVGFATPSGQTVIKNLQRALRGMGQTPGVGPRPMSAPPGLLRPNPHTQPGEANPELISFLKKNVTMYAVQPSMPKWCVRVNVDTGGKKGSSSARRPASAPAASSKNAKGKKGEKKKKSTFDAMTYYAPPQYGAANVKLTKKPKKKKEKPAK